jgi:hypothetical protein
MGELNEIVKRPSTDIYPVFKLYVFEAVAILTRGCVRLGSKILRAGRCRLMRMLHSFNEQSFVTSTPIQVVYNQ